MDEELDFVDVDKIPEPPCEIPEEQPEPEKKLKLKLKVKLSPYLTKQIILKTKLTAYTRGVIPDVSKFIEDAPQDGFIYGRIDGTWENISKAVNANKVLIGENSGLNRIPVGDDDDDTIIELSIRQWNGQLRNLPDKLEPDTVYYAAEDKPDLVLACGTAFSDEEESFDMIISGGNLETTTSQYEYISVVMNAKGEYDAR